VLDTGRKKYLANGGFIQGGFIVLMYLPNGKRDLQWALGGWGLRGIDVLCEVLWRETTLQSQSSGPLQNAQTYYIG